MRIIFIAFALVVTVFNSAAQEVLQDLPSNPYLPQKNKTNSSKLKATALSLPFFDDFSTSTGFPDASNWIDSFVYVNTHYPILPPSIGVATFDAVDAHGYVYEWLDDSPKPSDVLTSRIIDLSDSDQNSTYLSFYFQPQGLGNAPEFNDSLVLNIICDTNTYRLWQYNGTDYNSFKLDTLGIDDDSPDTLQFKLVHIKIDKPEYFNNTFQLQFVNYTSIAGADNPSAKTNGDHWHIDYVYLNDGRTAADTIFADVAMVESPTLFTKNYSSLPWSHFEKAINLEKRSIDFHVRNNDSRKRNLKKTFVCITDLLKQEEEFYYPDQKDVLPFFNYTDLTWSFSNSPIDWYYADSAQFEIECGFLTDDNDLKSNNSASRIINFKNYYAYDDGSAEKTYGVDSDRAKVAYLYESYVGDSLRAVQFYFARTQNLLNEDPLSFTLCVWAEHGGIPGQLLLQETGKYVSYGSNLNELVTINLDSTLYVEGKFFIGWEQNSDLLMNVGYDDNTIKRNRLFYNVNSTWYESDFSGALMMRPVLGKPLTNTSIQTFENAQIIELNMWPNPTQGNLNIELKGEIKSGNLQIFNYLGMKVYENYMNESSSLDISGLLNGVYIVSFIPLQGQSLTKRLIIQK